MCVVFQPQSISKFAINSQWCFGAGVFSSVYRSQFLKWAAEALLGDLNSCGPNMGGVGIRAKVKVSNDVDQVGEVFGYHIRGSWYQGDSDRSAAVSIIF